MPVRRAASRFALPALMFLLAACGDIATAGPPPDVGGTPPPSTTTTVVEGKAPKGEKPKGGDDKSEAIAAFENWVDALAEGEVEKAWKAMAQSSRKAFGSLERFAELKTDLAEGWGSWVAVEEASYGIETDKAGRTLLVASGTIFPEGHEEKREVAVPVVIEGERVLLSPFEEFGNVAKGLEEPEESSGPPVPADSGEGRRVVYSNSEQRVWLVEEDGTVRDTYLVSGKEDVPAPGTYEVFSKSELAYAGHDDITMTHMVRFTHGETLPIGFHAIPNDGSGHPLQSEDELGEYRSAGCVRQSPGHAAALYEWAPVGTKVVVLA